MRLCYNKNAKGGNLICFDVLLSRILLGIILGSVSVNFYLLESSFREIIIDKGRLQVI